MAEKTTGWQAGVSAPKDGRPFLAAWQGVWMRERSWRYAIIQWDDFLGCWVYAPHVIGTANKRPKRDGVGPWVYWTPEEGRHKWALAPEVWRELDPPPG